MRSEPGRTAQSDSNAGNIIDVDFKDIAKEHSVILPTAVTHAPTGLSRVLVLLSSSTSRPLPLPSPSHPDVTFETVSLDSFILDGDKSDLTFSKFLQRIRSREILSILRGPVCATFVRGPWQGSTSTRPLRTAEHPAGAPWLEGAQKRKIEFANVLHDRVAVILHTALMVDCTFTVIDSESWGTTTRGHPASPWCHDYIGRLLSHRHAQQGAFYLCSWGAPQPAPTRVVSNVPEILPILKHTGPPKLDNRLKYSGPLPLWCGHHHFQRRPAATAYPETLLEELAKIFILHLSRVSTSSLPEGVSATAATATSLTSCPTSSRSTCTRPPASPTSLSAPGPSSPSRPSLPTAPTLPTTGDTMIFDVAFLDRSPSLKRKKKAVKHRTAPAARREPLLADRDTSDDDETGRPRPLLGAGNLGKGPPLTTRWGGKCKPFHDGGGLCSRGRWLPSCRTPLAAPAVALRAIIKKHLASIPDRKRLLFCMACGRQQVSPFPNEMINTARSELAGLLLPFAHRLGPHVPPTTEALLHVAPFQPFLLNLLGAYLAAIDDPDFDILTRTTDSFTTGVRVGVGCRLPRTPAVFERKLKWRSLDDTPFDPQRENYASAVGAAKQLQAQFEEERALGMCFDVTLADAQQSYPSDSLRLASLAAMDKGDSTFRVLHDGTHGVRVNNDTQPRDQTRMPSAGELRRVLEHARSIGGLHFSLQSDVHKAHRRFKNAQRDWGYQACQVFEGTVWLNRVGTFGVGTACYWWARLAACLARAGLTVTDFEELWQLLFADDVLWIAAGPNFVDLILSCLFTWTLFGTPFKWVKCRGGLQQDWLGYWLDLETFSLGISAKRADWLIKWINEVLTAGSVLVRTFVEALGRFGFAAGVLEWDRPFLGPLYSWAAALPMSTYLRLPVLITLILEYLRDRLVRGARALRCWRLPNEAPLLFMADAKAEDDRVVIGGWCCADGGPRDARWFSLEFRACDWPELFTRVRNQSLIATWELMASLVSLVLFLPLDNDATATDFTTAQFAVTGVTDNQGNSFAVQKLLTSAFPLSVFLMELSIQLQRRALWMDLKWVNRDNNKLADALTNEFFEEFDMKKRIHITTDILKAHFTTAAVYAQRGAELYQQVEQLRAEARADRQARKAKSGPQRRHKQRRDRLRDTDPWG